MGKYGNGFGGRNFGLVESVGNPYPRAGGTGAKKGHTGGGGTGAAKVYRNTTHERAKPDPARNNPAARRHGTAAKNKKKKRRDADTTNYRRAGPL